jgi:hypothetical protein
VIGHARVSRLALVLVIVFLVMIIDCRVFSLVLEADPYHRPQNKMKSAPPTHKSSRTVQNVNGIGKGKKTILQIQLFVRKYRFQEIWGKHTGNNKPLIKIS